MSRFTTLLHREWMQHHRGWLVLMLLPPLLLLAAAPFSTVQFDPGDVSAASSLRTATGLMVMAMIAMPVIVLTLTVAAVGFQAAGLARRDVQDRSVGVLAVAADQPRRQRGRAGARPLRAPAAGRGGGGCGLRRRPRRGLHRQGVRCRGGGRAAVGRPGHRWRRRAGPRAVRRAAREPVAAAHRADHDGGIGLVQALGGGRSRHRPDRRPQAARDPLWRDGRGRHPQRAVRQRAGGDRACRHEQPHADPARCRPRRCLARQRAGLVLRRRARVGARARPAAVPGRPRRQRPRLRLAGAGVGPAPADAVQRPAGADIAAPGARERRVPGRPHDLCADVDADQADGRCAPPPAAGSCPPSRCRCSRSRCSAWAPPSAPASSSRSRKWCRAQARRWCSPFFSQAPPRRSPRCCYAELASTIAATGSSYSYTYATLGEFAAYLVAACLVLEYAIAGSAAAVGWSHYLNYFLGNAFGLEIPEWLRSPMLVSGPHGLEVHPSQFNLPPALLVVACCVLLLRGTRESAAANAVVVLIKLSILAFFVAIAFAGFDASHFTPFYAGHGFQGVTAAAGVVFFSFVGLDTVATAGGEVADPRRTVPRAILLALVIVVVSYMLVVVAAVGAQPIDDFAKQEAVLAAIVDHVSGRPWTATVVSAGAVISVFSVTLACIYGQTRILFGVARDGLLPPGLQNVSPRRAVPVGNTLIVSAGVGLIAALVDPDYLWDMVSLGTLVAFIVVSCAVPVLRRQLAGQPVTGFRVPFGPYVVPALSIVACVYVASDLASTTYRVFCIWMAVAFASYFIYGRRRSLLATA